MKMQSNKIVDKIFRPSHNSQSYTFAKIIMPSFSYSYSGLVTFILLSVIISLNTAEALRCVQCTSETDDNCKCNPPQPTECPKMYDHCITVTERERLAAGGKGKGKIRVFTRSCSPENLGNGVCIKGRTPEGDAKEICYTTCTEDGCNDKSLSSSDSCTTSIGDKIAGGVDKAGIALSDAWDKTKEGTKGAINATGEAFNTAGEKIDQKAAEIAARAGSTSLFHMSPLTLLTLTIVNLGVALILKR